MVVRTHREGALAQLSVFCLPTQVQRRVRYEGSVSCVGKDSAEQESDVRPLWCGLDDRPHRVAHLDKITALNSQHLKGKALIHLGR